MLSKWPIRRKLLVGIALLLSMITTLFLSGTYGLYAYRGLVRGLSVRSAELPLAAKLSQEVGDLRVTLSKVRDRLEFPLVTEGQLSVDNQLLRERFHMNLQSIEENADHYRDRLDRSRLKSTAYISDDRKERQTLSQIEKTLKRIRTMSNNQDWLIDEVKTDELAIEVEQLYHLAAELPSHFRQRLQALSQEVRLQYRTAIVITWTSTIAALATFIILVRFFYAWIFRPLGELVKGSRKVAEGEFGYRIHLQTEDEMSELADAMNAMTDRFEKIRDDLDRQVQQRTKQVVRSEQLASVGLLAAGVAHEINNPLASIAWSSESLERRFARIFGEGSEEDTEKKEFLKYLKMIQDEAFRCKEITEKLLDFSRMGEIQRQRTELRSLVQGVIEMVGHMGRYQQKHLDLLDGGPVTAQVNPQEMKQVVLNLISNGLDSVEPGGSVTIEVRKEADQAKLIFTDNGCGMSGDTLEHIFEPFFTRRREGQGTGLGLSITYRIIEDHHGQIDATSEGPGEGSQFTVTLPICALATDEEPEHRYQAA